MDNQKTGALIAVRRQELGWTQKQLAERLHISDRTVSKWERAAGFPDISLLEPLADALGLSVLELIHGRRMSPEEQPAPESERSIRTAAQVLGERCGRTLRRCRRAIIVLAALLACALTGFALLWLNPMQMHRVTKQEVSAAQALEVCPFALLTADDFELARLLLDDPEIGGLLVPAPSDENTPIPPDAEGFLVGEETAAPYRTLAQIEGQSPDRFCIEVFYNAIHMEYGHENRYCILSVFYDGLIRKTACEYGPDGEPKAIAENEDNIRFFVYQQKRDLIAPLFSE